MPLSGLCSLVLHFTSVDEGFSLSPKDGWLSSEATTGTNNQFLLLLWKFIATTPTATKTETTTIPLGLHSLHSLQLWINGLGLDPKRHQNRIAIVSSGLVQSPELLEDRAHLCPGVCLARLSSHREILVTDSSLLGWGEGAPGELWYSGITYHPWHLPRIHRTLVTFITRPPLG